MVRAILDGGLLPVPEGRRRVGLSSRFPPFWDTFCALCSRHSAAPAHSQGAWSVWVLKQECYFKCVDSESSHFHRAAVRRRPSTDPRVAFGEAVRERRRGIGLSQEELADVCGLHRTYVGGIERGERNLSLLNMARIAAALRICLSQLVVAMEERLRLARSVRGSPTDAGRRCGDPSSVGSGVVRPDSLIAVPRARGRRRAEP